MCFGVRLPGILLGKALRGRRDQVAIATKFGFRLPEGVEPHPFPIGYACGEAETSRPPPPAFGHNHRSRQAS